MVYQEQVMQVLHSLGGIPLRAAYTIIKAISKKKHDVINAARADFIKGSAAHGVSSSQASELFELILKFAGYGFNKSHSTGYAIIAYQTAWLKTYFPNQYMAAVLTYESQARKVEEWAPYLEDCRRTLFSDHTAQHPHVGVQVEPPDLNLSDAGFSVVFKETEPHDALHGHIRFGLNAIKGAGESAIRAILTERTERGRFESLFDFAERADLRNVNRATLEALIKAGAFDSLHGRELRASMLASLDDVIASGQAAARDREAGQMNFFGSFAEAPSAVKVAPKLRPAAEWDVAKLLAAEKEALGFHVSGHPLDRFDHLLREFCNATSVTLTERAEDSTIVIGGMITRVRTVIAKNGRNAGNKMAMITLADKAGVIEGVLFSEVFAQHAHLLKDDALVILIGAIDKSRAEPGIIVDRLILLENAAEHLGKSMEIEVVDDPTGGSITSSMQMAAGLLKQAAALNGSIPGQTVDVFIHVHEEGRRVTLRAERLRVVPERTLVGRLGELFGPERVRVRGGFVPQRQRRQSGGPRREG
jgi:DNA polymerase III subunit alpha